MSLIWATLQMKVSGRKKRKMYKHIFSSSIWFISERKIERMEKSEKKIILALLTKFFSASLVKWEDEKIKIDCQTRSCQKLNQMDFQKKKKGKKFRFSILPISPLFYLLFNEWPDISIIIIQRLPYRRHTNIKR